MRNRTEAECTLLMLGVFVVAVLAVISTVYVQGCGGAAQAAPVVPNAAFDALYPLVGGPVGTPYPYNVPDPGQWLEVILGTMSAVRGAVDGRDSAALASSAHALKGAVSHFEARHAVETSKSLELIGLSGRMDEAEGPMAELERGIDQLRDALESVSNRTSTVG